MRNNAASLCFLSVKFIMALLQHAATLISTAQLLTVLTQAAL